MNTNNRASMYRKANRHLSRQCPILKALMEQVGPCTLELSPGSFIVLVRSIVSQLISTAAAKTIYARIEAAVGDTGAHPASILALGEERLRGVGLSGAKARSLLDLAERTLDGRLPLDHLAELSDEDAIARLVEVRGIGVWTAEMYLIFSLGRLDVLPVADLGLRAGVRDRYGMEDLPRPRELRALAEPWRPYRSIATWYFWRSRGAVPQSEAKPPA
jgi:DNA-3-methyladenine glycosylase II